MKQETKESLIVLGIAAAIAAVLLLTGCASTAKKAIESASEKNVSGAGSVMTAKGEMTSATTNTPQGLVLMGSVEYKSRNVGISADKKTPNTGYYKHIKRKTLLGTEETITEWDYTAGSEADAKSAREAFEAKQKADKEAETTAEDK